MTNIKLQGGVTSSSIVPRPSVPIAAPAIAAYADLRALFLQQCTRFGAATAYAILADDLNVAAEVTFSDLRSNVVSLAGALTSRCRPGDRVVLALENGLDCAEMFWACIVAGLVAVPSPAPRQLGEVGARRLRGIVEDSGAALVVTAPEHRDELAHLPVAWASRQSLSEAAPASPPDVSIAPHDLAYLQYTSGSTSEPRGVELTHANVMAHCTILQPVIDRSGPPTSILSWLPWFHDFGLIQGLFSPIYLGIPTYLMPTIAFMRRPLSWLDAITKFKISDSGAPDSAFVACLKALSRKPGWSGDLSSWTLAITGGEPVRAETLESFAQAFAPHGFRSRTFAPAYGMAEAVLALSMKPPGELPLLLHLDPEALQEGRVRDAQPGRAQRTFVGSGTFLDGIDVRIVEPERAIALAPDEIGEIWVRGPSIGRGYKGQAALSKQTFGAQLADDGKAGARYLRTGDLGFVRDGQIFITGRLKDIIVVHGRNLYPHDLELTAESAHPSVRASGTIAFGVEREDGEAVVVLAECAGKPDAEKAREVIDRIRSEVSGEHGIEVQEVVLVRRGTLPQTSSGKPQRSVAKRAYLKGDYESETRLHARPAREIVPGPKDDAERIVAEAWKSVLNPDRLDVEADFFALGGNSLIATQLVSRINAASGADLPIRAVFEAPSVAGLSEKLREALAGGGAAGARVQLPTKRFRGGVSELSLSQERFWFVCQQVPDSTALNMPVALRVKGRFNVAAFNAALASVVERHDILRTTFHTTEAGAEARVHPQMPIEFRTTKLGSGDAGSDGFELALEHQLALYAQQPFDLENGPLIRAHFIEVAPDDAVVLLVMHHIVGDQWSFGVLLRELAHFYRLALGRNEAALPALPLQYADFAAWQRDTFEREGRTRDEAYWVERLEGMEAVSLPTDFPRLNRPIYRGARHRVRFDPKLAAKLSALGARHSASLSMIMMTALNVLLQRYTGRDDIGIGVSVAGRNHGASEALIGTFVNVLVLRTQVDRTLDFATLLGRVRQNALDALAHQEMPFDQLVWRLKHQKDASRAPLFQVLFNMVNVPVDKLGFGDAQISLINFDRGSAQYELTVLADAEHDFSIQFEYAVQVFQPETIQRFASHYVRLLEAVAEAEPCPVAELSPVGRGETARIAALGRGPDLPLPVETVPAWLEPAWEEWSGKPAVIFEDEALSYRELDLASSAVARALRARGIGRGKRVGLHVSRSARSIVAQVGVLKSGAAYVPLDPVNPPQRLEYIVRDADLSLILVDTDEDPTPIWMGNIPTLGMAELMANGLDAGDGDVDARELDARADDPAYVLYTSGSTGEPKGVLISHRSLVNLMSSVGAEPGVTSADRVLAVTTLNFDISVVETLLPLGFGATVVVAGREDAVDGNALLGLIERHEVSLMQATPSTWYLLLNAGWTGSGSLKKALVGGETLPQRLAIDLVRRCDEVWNMYGPTETTVWSTVWRVTSPDSRAVSIGRPIANTQVYVLDSDLHVCPIGVEGDLYIGGVGVGLGYVGLPELTARRFLPDHFAPGNTSARLYRTGDRARWLNDGTLVHLGRSDTQVKLRGYRIEVGEIEAVLLRHPDVERAVVVVREVAPGDPRLVAFVVRRQNKTSADGLRQYLSRFVPDYMLPQHIALLEQMPLLPNGKVDHRKLADVALEAAPTRPIRAPRTPQEQQIWNIWRDVLGIENFGIDDNFFDLGGHSMLALKVANRVQNEVDAACTIPMLFQHPTIAGFAAAMRDGARTDTPLVVVLQEVGETPPLFCICGTYLYQDLANQLAPHRQVCALFVPSEVAILRGDADRKSLSVESIAADYVREIEKKQPKGPYYLAGLSFGGLLAFEVAQQLRRKGAEVAFLAMFDTVMPIGPVQIAARSIAYRIGRLPQDGLSWFFTRGRLLISQAMSALRHRRDRKAAMTSTGWPIDDEVHQAELRNAVYFRAARRYRPQPYDGAAVLMLAEDSRIPGTTKVWTRLIRKLEVLRVRGDHLGILKAPHVGVVAQHLIARLGAGRPPKRPPIA